MMGMGVFGYSAGSLEGPSVRVVVGGTTEMEG
jgi:hypothetical protein